MNEVLGQVQNWLSWASVRRLQLTTRYTDRVLSVAGSKKTNSSFCKQKTYQEDSRAAPDLVNSAAQYHHYWPRFLLSFCFASFSMLELCSCHGCTVALSSMYSDMTASRGRNGLSSLLSHFKFKETHPMRLPTADFASHLFYVAISNSVSGKRDGPIMTGLDQVRAHSSGLRLPALPWSTWLPRHLNKMLL